MADDKNSAGQKLDDYGHPKPKKAGDVDPGDKGGESFRAHRELVANEGDTPIREGGSGVDGGVI